MHVRVRRERIAAREARFQPDTRVLQKAIERRAEQPALCFHLWLAAEHEPTLRKAQQRKRLVIEIDAIVDTAAVRRDQGSKQAIGPAIVTEKVIEGTAY